MKLACQEPMIPGSSLEEKWDVAAKAGFDGIELIGRGDLEFEGRLDELQKARSAGVVFSSVCVAMDHFIGDQDAERRRDAVANLKSLLSTIAELGGSGAITPASFGVWSNALPPWQRPPRSPEDDKAILKEAVGELAEHALPLNVAVLFEPLNRYEDHMINRVSQAAEVCRAVGVGSAKVMADAFHMNIEEDDPAHSLRREGDLIGHIHLADSGRQQPGTGHIDWSAFMGALHDIGYRGWMALECGLRGDPERALREAAALIRSYM